MIIAKRTAQRLIAVGKATIEGRVYDNDQTYAIITRHDVQRTDHYLIGDGDLRR